MSLACAGIVDYKYHANVVLVANSEGRGDIMLFEDLGLLFFTILALSLLLVPLSILLARYLDVIDNPIERSVHVYAVPRLGGLGMTASMLIGLLLFAPLGNIIQGFLVGLVVISFIGFADDMWNIKARWKMLGQILATILFIEISGVTLDSLGDLLHMGEVSFSPPIAYAATIFLVVSGINCFNFSDGLDGLISGAVAIMCILIAVLALSTQTFIVLLIIIALLAAIIGFLKFNTFPAKLFMGDCGSLMLGYSICTMSITLAVDSEYVIKPITLFIITAMPIVDTFWVMIRRIILGINPAKADKTHLHHRLLALGLPHSMVVSVLYAWVALFGCLALFVKDMPEYWQLGSVVLLIAALYALLVVCEKKGVHLTFEEKDEKEIKQQFVKLIGYSMKVFPYVILIGLSIPLLFIDSFVAGSGQLAFSMAVLIALMFPWNEHHQRLSVVYGLYYLAIFIVLWVWNSSSYNLLSLNEYMGSFTFLLLLWAAFKIKFKSRHEVFLTSSFEILLIFTSWFVPYVVLPAFEVPVAVMDAAKLSCLEAIPLLIAMKLIIKRQPDRNRNMGLALIMLLLLIGIKALL